MNEKCIVGSAWCVVQPISGSSGGGFGPCTIQHPAHYQPIHRPLSTAQQTISLLDCSGKMGGGGAHRG